MRDPHHPIHFHPPVWILPAVTVFTDSDKVTFVQKSHAVLEEVRDKLAESQDRHVQDLKTKWILVLGIYVLLSTRNLPDYSVPYTGSAKLQPRQATTSLHWPLQIPCR